MKKYLVLAAALLLSSCACFNSEEEEEVYVPNQKRICAKGDASCHQSARYTRTYEERQVRPARNYDEDVYYRRPRQTSYRILTTEDLGERTYRRPEPVVVQAPAPQPAVVQVVQQPAPAAAVVQTKTSTVSGEKCNSCEPTIRETREPVEILYKKTTYKTVYEPKTTEEISYEKVPYKQETQDTVVKEVVTTTTTTTSPQSAPVVMTVEERK